jgi:dihydropteroate synthase
MSRYSGLDQVLSSVGKRTLIMGILNATPDSFSDGGMFASPHEAVDRAMEMVAEGADIIDIGGESTRPGSGRVSTREELRRVIPIVELLAAKTCAPISVDTYKAAVAREALECGAAIINDISAATFDPDMRHVIAASQCGAVLMHIPGIADDLHYKPVYSDVLADIATSLSRSVDSLISAGAERARLMVDPGFGFGKTVDQNLEIIRRLSELTSLGLPILIGTSRKSTIGAVLGGLPADERIEGTAATVAISIANGADIVRVHDVKQMSRVVRVADAIVRRIPAE